MADRIARRRGIEHDLRRHEERFRDMQQRLEHARTAFRKAEADLALASVRASYTEVECASIRELLAFDPDMVNGLPCELLQAIFALAFASTDWRDIQRADYSRERSLLPYTLGAVCRHWRQVVQNTPELWTYIAAPPLHSQHYRCIADYVQRHLELSQSRPLQLCLVHPGSVDDQWFVDLLTTLSKHAPRWGRVMLLIPRMGMLNELLSAQSISLLEELYLASFLPAMWADHPMSIDAQWLSNALNLRRLFTDGIALRISAPLPRLQSASLHVIDMPGFDAVKEALQHVPSLQTLILGFFWVIIPSTRLLAPIHLPALESLTIRSTNPNIEGIVTRLVSAPRLRKLSICPSFQEPVASWGRSYVAAFPEITDLQFVGNSCLTAEHGVTFGGLGRIRRLTFIRCAFPRQPGTGAYFWLKATGTGHTLSRVWPELEDVELSSYARDTYSHQVLHDLCYFVRTRCDAPRKPFRLALVQWPVERFPLDFALAFALMLGPDNVRMETDNGRIQSFADNGVWDALPEEEEAQFTDCDDDLSSECDGDSGEWSSGGTDGEVLPRTPGRLRVNGPDWEDGSTDASDFEGMDDSD
ncbi:hypothetical protein AURDEDRAFT_160092 [Auricularia subglabra TFB-10046 SS5]|nr:hypothetical protein AURDEDRAFT_160092 [Auricularia subglabra TFB-10046 SS5]